MHTISENVTLDQELLAFLKSVYAESERLIPALKREKPAPKDAYLIALHHSIVQFTDALILLFDERKYILVPATVRSILETYVDFNNICDDEKYIEEMEISNNINIIKRLNLAKEGKNPYLVGIATIENIDEIIKALSAKVANMKGRLVKDGFDKAKLSDEYVGLYKHLSENSHSTLGALYYRHFEKDGDSFAIVYGKDLSADALVPYLETASSLLMNAITKANILYGDKDENKYNELAKTFGEIRAKY
jgi:hypothetical protein